VCRLVRGQFLKERAMDYVTAARAAGLPTHRIIFRHVLPNAFAPVLVAATFGVASAILVENTLAFIGLGDVTVPSWGRTLDDGRVNEYWHLILPPTVAIFLTVTALNLVGDGIRDALDPKLRN
jgi:peptide/nickel transport system permease protein